MGSKEKRQEVVKFLKTWEITCIYVAAVVTAVLILELVRL